MDSPQPTLEEQITELREKVEALEGALNALVVVWAVRRLPGERMTDAADTSEVPKSGEDR